MRNKWWVMPAIALIAAFGGYTSLFAKSDIQSQINQQTESGPIAGRDQFNNYNNGPDQKHYDQKIEELGRWKERYYELEKKYRELEKSLQDTIGNDDQIKSLKEQAYQELKKGNLPEAEKLLLEAENYSQKDIADLKVNIGDLKFIQSDFEGASNYYSQAVELVNNVSDVKLAEYMDKLGSTLSHLEKCQEAKPILEKSLAIREKVFGLHNPNVAESLNNLAVCEKDTIKREEHLKRAASIMKKELNVEWFFPEGVHTIYQWNSTTPKETRLMKDINTITEKYRDDPTKAVAYSGALAAIYSNWNDQVNSGYFYELASKLDKKIPNKKDIYDANRYLSAATNLKIQILNMMNIQMTINQALGSGISEQLDGILRRDISDAITQADSFYRESIEIYEKELGEDDQKTIEARKSYDDFLTQVSLKK